ncbi:uncharacterized protein BT62DRAFT_928981 [Guyanagaster necrorhizus]|uniref:Uncharacterized protein n=1 Tax=Guyanagaster necrorhizus TaxID=856835 RepID=A0A9P7VXD2_9AGAR|nr:uncharacterized protein BT62DRAFT_928981 [Guyanagaster necrorhizus MCA 3950]KAG7448978.1 hypothetical protein BT62DRAFT_928981 [Guyanagaster necrorhizus MCA 3950]
MPQSASLWSKVLQVVISHQAVWFGSISPQRDLALLMLAKVHLTMYGSLCGGLLGTKRRY